MTAPTAGSTPRPWKLRRYTNDQWMSPEERKRYAWVELDAKSGKDTSPLEKADAALIVYAVNHIEQAEADRDEALRLLRMLDRNGYGTAETQEFLRAHPAPVWAAGPTGSGHWVERSVTEVGAAHPAPQGEVE